MPDTDLIENRLKPLRGDPLPETGAIRTLVVDQNWIWRKAGLVISFFLIVIVSMMTLTPMPPGGNITGGIDKLYHFVAFGAIIFPLILTDSRRWLWAVPGIILYGGLIELIQPSIGRSAEWLDFGADITGVMARAALAELLHDRIHKSVFDSLPARAADDGEAEAERREQMRAELRDELRVVLMEELAAMRHETGRANSGPVPAEATPTTELSQDQLAPKDGQGAPAEGSAPHVSFDTDEREHLPSAQVFELPQDTRRVARG